MNSTRHYLVNLVLAIVLAGGGTMAGILLGFSPVITTIIGISLVLTVQVARHKKTKKLFGTFNEYIQYTSIDYIRIHLEEIRCVSDKVTEDGAQINPYFEIAVTIYNAGLIPIRCILGRGKISFGSFYPFEFFTEVEDKYINHNIPEKIILTCPILQPALIAYIMKTGNETIPVQISIAVALDGEEFTFRTDSSCTLHSDTLIPVNNMDMQYVIENEKINSRY